MYLPLDLWKPGRQPSRMTAACKRDIQNALLRAKAKSYYAQRRRFFEQMILDFQMMQNKKLKKKVLFSIT